MVDPVIYGPAFSTYVRSVRLALEEKGAPYRLEEINILEDAHQTPEYRARHPFAKVPAFEHDGCGAFGHPQPAALVGRHQRTRQRPEDHARAGVSPSFES